MTPLDHFNSQLEPDAVTALLACCGAQRWAQTLAAGRPYDLANDLLDASTQLWFSLDEPDHLEAFACHPRIGEAQAPTAASPAFATHSTSEQALARQTQDPALAGSLAEGNRLYEQRFGFLYLVFAAGRTTPQLLELLTERLTHSRDEELAEAAFQQDLITRKRIERWLQL